MTFAQTDFMETLQEDRQAMLNLADLAIVITMLMLMP